MPLKRARAVSFVPQHADVEGELTVEEIVRLGRTPYRKAFQRSTRDDDMAVEEAIRPCGYADYASGGGSNCLAGSVSEPR